MSEQLLAESEAALVREGHRVRRVSETQLPGTAGRTPSPSAEERAGRPRSNDEIIVAGIALFADLAGTLYWPEERLLVVSDLHLEKGSSFAARGVLLPPYDTAATLECLDGTLSCHDVRTVVALGDNFHDQGGPARLATADRVRLSGLQRGRDWIWIAGNHDPDPADRIGGTFAKALAIGPLVFRHEPAADASPGEIAGHLHPVARISRRGHTVTRRCFASDGTRLVMPAFGAYTGGLDIRHAAFARVFGARNFTGYLIGQRRLYAFAAGSHE
jgi:DNA ligase-associated metallophosphoesterase